VRYAIRFSMERPAEGEALQHGAGWLAAAPGGPSPGVLLVVEGASSAEAALAVWIAGCTVLGETHDHWTVALDVAALRSIFGDSVEADPTGPVPVVRVPGHRVHLVRLGTAPDRAPAAGAPDQAPADDRWPAWREWDELDDATGRAVSWAYLRAAVVEAAATLRPVEPARCCAGCSLAALRDAGHPAAVHVLAVRFAWLAWSCAAAQDAAEGAELEPPRRGAADAWAKNAMQDPS
jgi:hypothetical protein